MFEYNYRINDEDPLITVTDCYHLGLSHRFGTLDLIEIFENMCVGLVKVRSMQRSGSEAIRTQIQPLKPKREISNITNSQNTKENVWLTE